MQDHICSPIKFAVCLGNEESNPANKLLYKNNEYLNEIRIIFVTNPKEDDTSCFFTAASMLLYRMVNYESVQFLRKKFAYLVNYQRLITAQEPELTMERFVTEIMNDRCKELPEDMFANWHSQALNSGVPRVFNFLLSYIVNNPLYVLDLSTNQWRENDLSNANPEQSEFHANFIREYLPLNPIGPPFMLAAHMEMVDGILCGTHVAPMMHEHFVDCGIVAALPLEIYIKFMTHPKMIESHDYNFIFASDSESDDESYKNDGECSTDEDSKNEDEDYEGSKNEGSKDEDSEEKDSNDEQN